MTMNNFNKQYRLRDIILLPIVTILIVCMVVYAGLFVLSVIVFFVIVLFFIGGLHWMLPDGYSPSSKVSRYIVTPVRSDEHSIIQFKWKANPTNNKEADK